MQSRIGTRQLCFVVTALALCATLLVGADWPQWRGPERTGISTEKGLLQDWPKEGPRLLWQLTDIGDGYATPSISGGRVYLLSNRGMDDEFVQALSASDGKVLWTRHLGGVGNPKQQPAYPMARSTPTIDGDLLYTFTSDGEIACLRTATGEVVWQKSVRKEFAGKPGTWAYAESPLIDGDVLIVTPGGPDATIVALNKKTGAVIWKSAVPGGDAAGYSSAIVVQAASRKQYVQFLDKGLVGVDSKTGKFLWRYTQTSGGPANIATPVAHNNYVYSTNSRRFGGGLVQLNATEDGVAAEPVYFVRDAPNTLGGQVLLGNHLFGTNQQGPAVTEFATGKILWQTDSIGPGAVLYADSRVYLHTENGEVALFEATADAYREKGRFTPPEAPKRRDSRERAWSYPVVSDGRLYIRDLGTLWCFDVKDRKAGK